MLVKVFDRGQWNRISLNDDGTWSGTYCPRPMDYRHLPEAHKLCNGCGVVRYGRHFWAMVGPAYDNLVYDGGTWKMAAEERQCNGHPDYKGKIAARVNEWARLLHE